MQVYKTYFDRLLNYFLKKQLSQPALKKAHLTKAVNTISLSTVKPVVERLVGAFDFCRKAVHPDYAPTGITRSRQSEYFVSLGLSCSYLTLPTASEVGSHLKYQLLYLFLRHLFLKKNSKEFGRARKLLSTLKLMVLSQQSAHGYASSRNSGSSQNLVLYQTLNDYFFSPAFYFNVNKGSR